RDYTIIRRRQFCLHRPSTPQFPPPPFSSPPPNSAPPFYAIIPAKAGIQNDGGVGKS
ncbi:MAG: hypothetical protein HAW59_01440, partial [Betaproteobacteria bacterium]|nr:hypothetical protein [Betaproteobacteria bacterium]